MEITVQQNEVRAIANVESARRRGGPGAEADHRRAQKTELQRAHPGESPAGGVDCFSCCQSSGGLPSSSMDLNTA